MYNNIKLEIFNKGGFNMAREGKTKFEAYIDNVIAKPFKEVLQKESLSFTKWLEEEQKKYTNKKKYIEKK